MQQRSAHCLLGASLNHGFVQLTFGCLEFPHVVEEPRDTDSTFGVGQSSEESDKIVERFTDDSAVDSAVQVRLIAVDLLNRIEQISTIKDGAQSGRRTRFYRRMNNSSQTECQAGYLLADPVRVTMIDEARGWTSAFLVDERPELGSTNLTRITSISPMRSWDETKGRRSATSRQ